MSDSFWLESIAKTDDLIADLLLRQTKLDKKATFMVIKSINPKYKQSEVAREAKMSPPTLKCYRTEINLVPPYRLPNTHTRKQSSSDHEHKMTSNDHKMTSNDLQMTSKDSNENDKPVSKKVKTQNIIRGGDPIILLK